MSEKLVDIYQGLWLNEEFDRAALGLGVVNPWQRPTGCKVTGFGEQPTDREDTPLNQRVRPGRSRS